jgi:acyl-CoA reductase-like NAD-dependent aldehyde dehydrogenase
LQIVKHEIRIEVSTEPFEDRIEAFVSRGDQQKTIYYANISQQSVDRLRHFAEEARAQGRDVLGARSTEGPNLQFHIILRPSRP